MQTKEYRQDVHLLDVKTELTELELLKLSFHKCSLTFTSVLAVPFSCHFLQTHLSEGVAESSEVSPAFFVFFGKPFPFKGVKHAFVRS